MSKGKSEGTPKSRPSRKGQGSGRSKLADSPVASYPGEGCISDTALTAAEKVGKVQLDKALKDKVERALASYVAKARVEQKGPSAKEVTAFVERLIAVSTDASNVLEELQRLEPVVVEVKRQLRKTLIRASDPSRAESPQGTPTKSSKSQELLELNSFLGSKAEIRRLRALNGHFLSASEQVLSHSKAEGSTTEKTALLYCLQELREIYTDAGGKATAGSNDRPSAFSRFAFALLDGLPRPTPKRSIEEINNLIRNHLF